jgi:DNA-binding response OmpR family regulator
VSRKLVITIADDDFNDQQLIESALKEIVANCHVNSVYTGRQLLNHLEKSEMAPDLIFLDLNMPDDDGLMALKKLNERSAVSIPVCILTTRASEKDMKMAIDLGAVAFYHKPSKYSELLDIVKAVCADCLGQN